MNKLRFHLLGVAYSETHKINSVCPFTQKIIRLAKMLKDYGHTVYFYGVEGSEVECDEFIQVSTKDIIKETYGSYDKSTMIFNHDPNNKANYVFNDNAIKAILARKKDRDILLCPMGTIHKPIADSVHMLTVEPGIGYPGTFAPFRVFESYAWMHYNYGLEKKSNGGWYDAVIPNYFDPEDFRYECKKDDYLLYFGRISSCKGVQIASDVAKVTGNELYIVGQGSLDNPSDGLNLSKEKHIKYHSAVGPEERAEIMSKAKALLMPTLYLEPFGAVCLEAQMCGTPVITTDWGAFPETVLHGVTGYRCRTFEEFTWAVRNISNIKPEKVREWAVSNYSMERVGKMYEEYFQRVANLYDKGWYQPNDERLEFDWLKRIYPN